MRRLAVVVFAALTCACVSPGGGPAAAPPGLSRTAWIVAADGSAVGQATFTEAPAGVLIRLEFSQAGLPPGWHGLHMHDTGDCSDFAAGFQASGGHITTHGRARHGLMHPQGAEAGDLPNLFVGPGGVFGAEFYATNVTMGDQRLGNRMPLLDEDGSALLIHAGPDDHQTQPIGGAGDRIACAAIRRLP